MRTSTTRKCDHSSDRTWETLPNAIRKARPVASPNSTSMYESPTLGPGPAGAAGAVSVLATHTTRLRGRSAVTGSDERPELSAIYITSIPRLAAPPCGACRQVLAEFGNPLISFLGQEGRQTVPLSELLPIPFVP